MREIGVSRTNYQHEDVYKKTSNRMNYQITATPFKDVKDLKLLHGIEIIDVTKNKKF